MIRQTYAASLADIDIDDPRTWPDELLDDQRRKVWAWNRECLCARPLVAPYWADWAVRLEAETARRLNPVAVCQEAA